MISHHDSCNFCSEALSAFERDYSQAEKQSMNLKIHAQKAELMLDYARANLYLADYESRGIFGPTAYANECI